VEDAGREMAAERKLSGDVKARLEKDFSRD